MQGALRISTFHGFRLVNANGRAHDHQTAGHQKEPSHVLAWSLSNINAKLLSDQRHDQEYGHHKRNPRKEIQVGIENDIPSDSNSIVGFHHGWQTNTPECNHHRCHGNFKKGAHKNASNQQVTDGGKDCHDHTDAVDGQAPFLFRFTKFRLDFRAKGGQTNGTENRQGNPGGESFVRLVVHIHLHGVQVHIAGLGRRRHGICFLSLVQWRLQ
mmetsp:Transcript_23725/g.49260  ORF Transcript_23725/g.49260 Transcript_23725/m.49260 type:complete len:212 (+) Transcript_23725:594-1229(+)